MQSQPDSRGRHSPPGPAVWKRRETESSSYSTSSTSARFTTPSSSLTRAATVAESVSQVRSVTRPARAAASPRLAVRSPTWWLIAEGSRLGSRTGSGIPPNYRPAGSMTRGAGPVPARPAGSLTAEPRRLPGPGPSRCAEHHGGDPPRRPEGPTATDPDPHKENPVARLFGTDGVRGRANGDITAELAVELSVGAAHVL